MNHIQKAHWRQYTQAHTDWVNDILLCNTNQTGMFYIDFDKYNLF